MNFWSEDQCSAAYEDIGIEIDATAEICAYEEVHIFNQTLHWSIDSFLFFQGKDFCYWDDGGPLICNDKLTGVVSWGNGKGCAEKSFPGVYANVKTYINWIETGENGVENIKPMISVLVSLYSLLHLLS